jgi:beta-glucosidase
LNPTINFTEQLFIDYRHFDANRITPQYEFGFGLSYTTFDYSKLSVVEESGGVTVTFTVQNNGTVSGTEIPQLYLGFPNAAGEPPKVLRGFDDLQLSPGASATVTMSLNARDLR